MRDYCAILHLKDDSTTAKKHKCVTSPCGTAQPMDGKQRSSKSTDKTRDLENTLGTHSIEDDDSSSDSLNNSSASSFSKDSVSNQDSTFLSLTALFYKYPGQEEIIDQLTAAGHLAHHINIFLP
eukprot:7076092-Ditylum_brightwellii.AAC.1